MKRFHNHDGYTILEMGIASMILAFVFASTIAVAGHCFRYTADMRRSSQSWQIAQQKIEDLRLKSWSYLDGLPKYPSTSSFTDPNDTAGIFQGTITIGNAGHNGSATLLLATVTVSYTNQTAGIITNSLSTLFSNGGLNGLIQ
jgi:type II secretory pathway pseudopilin PulG